MSSSVGGHKRIAKNTLFMYIRLLVTMPVAFITSRIVLNELGVTDYGIYNAVAGIVMFFSTLRGAFASATQRFYNVFIGKGDKQKLSEVFTTSLLIHCIIAIVLICAIEFFGYWFINNEMNYPVERRNVTLFLFQMIVLATSFQIINIPFDAMVIAHERMSFYSYISVTESILKLAVAYFLVHFHGDKLFLYSLSIPCIGAFVLLATVFYCFKEFKSIRLVIPKEKQLAKELSKFAGWSLVSNMVYSFVNEGLNLLLNVFGGVLANTARGIAYQVKNAIHQVLSSTFVSVRPQAIQMYSRNEYDSFYTIIYTYSKIIYFLAVLIIIPIFYYLDDILQLWLGQIPQYSIIFLRILLIHTLIRSFHEPLDVIFKASGRVRQYESITILLRVLIFPMSWLALKLSFPIYSIFVILVFAELALWFSLVLLAREDGLDVIKYIRLVIFPVGCVTVLGFMSAYIIKYISFLYFFKILFLIIVLLLFIWLIGLSRPEKEMIFNIVNRHK